MFKLETKVDRANCTKPVLYEGGIPRTTLSSKHVKRKRKNERGKQFNLNKNGYKKFNNGY